MGRSGGPLHGLHPPDSGSTPDRPSLPMRKREEPQSCVQLAPGVSQPGLVPTTVRPTTRRALLTSHLTPYPLASTEPVGRDPGAPLWGCRQGGGATTLGAQTPTALPLPSHTRPPGLKDPVGVPFPGEVKAWASGLGAAEATGWPLTLTYLMPAGSSQELAGGLCVRGRSLEAGFNTICKSRQQKQLLGGPEAEPGPQAWGLQGGGVHGICPLGGH